MLQEALALHQKGELEKARELYEKLLQQEPANCDALHLLGVVLHQTGDSAAGARLIEHAIRLSPKQGAFYNNLGEALRGCQRWVDAANAYQKSVEFSPHLAGAWYWLGVCFWQLNDFQRASEALGQAVLMKPEQSHWRMGLAQVYKGLQRWQDAEKEYRAVLVKAPKHHDANLNLGDVLLKCGNADAAATVLAALVVSQPSWSLAWCNYALALQQLGKLEEAEFAINNALKLAPDSALAHLNAAVIAHYMGDYEKAEQESIRALVIDPKLNEARFNLANYQLLRKDPEGWKNFSVRWQLPNLKLPNFAEYHHFNATEWQGETLTDKHIVVFPEQGIGDSLQFLRYVSVLRQHAAKVSVGVIPPLKQFVRTLDVDVEWIDDVRTLPTADFKVAMLSLPSLTSAWLNGKIPASIPIKQGAFINTAWRDKLAALGTTKRKIGLVWSGSVTQSTNRFRKIPISDLALLQPATESVQFVILQKGLPSEEINAVEKALNAVNWTDSLTDFYQTAALINELDAVISVDTSVAHITGQLNKPGWICLSTIADWRWGQGETSEYYSSLHLNRQAKLNAWKPLVERLLKQLS